MNIKKIIGYIIVSLFMAFILFVFIYIVVTNGWRFVIGLLASLAIYLLGLFGLYLISNNKN